MAVRCSRSVCSAHRPERRPSHWICKRKLIPDYITEAHTTRGRLSNCGRDSEMDSRRVLSAWLLFLNFFASSSLASLYLKGFVSTHTFHCFLLFYGIVFISCNFSLLTGFFHISYNGYTFSFINLFTQSKLFVYQHLILHSVFSQLFSNFCVFSRSKVVALVNSIIYLYPEAFKSVFYF